MDLIQTNSFKLAIYHQGDENAHKLALVLPGRMDTKDYSHMRSHVDFLAKRSFLAVSFDPPGTWESGGDTSIYSMTNYLKAVNELIYYFGNRPTLAVGHSRGGCIAMLAAIENTQVVGLVNIMGRYSLSPQMLGKKIDPSWQSQGYLINKRDLPNNPNKYREFKLPYSFYVDQSQYDMSAGLAKSTKPKLFIGGARDTTIPIEIIKKAYDISNGPKEFQTLDSDHNYRLNPKLIERVNKMIGEFLDQYPQVFE